MRGFRDGWREFIVPLGSDTFTVCLLAAAFAAAVLRLIFGAGFELVMGLLALGAVTALAETDMRAKQ